MSKYNFFKKILKINFNGEIIEHNKKYKIFDEVKKLNFLRSKKRKLVLIFCYNEMQSIISYLWTLANNNVAILINSNLDQDLVDNLIKKYSPDIIISKNMSNYKNYDTKKEINGFYYLNKISLSKNKFYKDLALLLPTSGSTGSPKFVRISYKNLYYNTKDITNYLKVEPSDTTITTLPFSYTYGMSIINSHIFVPSKILAYNGTVIEKTFFDLIKKWKVNNFGGVPLIFEMLQRLKLENFDLSSLKYITQAGGPLSKKLIKFFHFSLKKKKIKFITMYGSTEATSRMSYLPPKFNLTKTSSIGKGLQKSFKIINLNTGKEIKKYNETGELVYFGKNVCLGYSLSSKDLSLEDQNKGILKTGDIGFKDKDDFFYVTGRLDRYIKIYGQRINIDDIEKILSLKFSNICVKYNNNKMLIFSDKNYDRKKVIEYISTKIKIHKNIIDYIKVPELPRNLNGKIDYAKL